MKKAKKNKSTSSSLKFDIPVMGKVGRDKKGLFYDYFVRITLEEINLEGTVSHNHYARFFGKTRELFALDHIPGFATDMGRVFLLQTCNATYNFKKNFRFGDIMLIKMRVLEVGNTSFDLEAEFINVQKKEVCTTAKQTIIYTDLKGAPKKIPNKLRAVLMDTLLPI